MKKPGKNLIYLIPSGALIKSLQFTAPDNARFAEFAGNDREFMGPGSPEL